MNDGIYYFFIDWGFVGPCATDRFPAGPNINWDLNLFTVAAPALDEDDGERWKDQ